MEGCFFWEPSIFFGKISAETLTIVKIDLLQYQPSLKLRKQDGQTFIHDPIRKKHLVQTPEEVVRQLVLAYLLEEKNFPKNRIRTEKINELRSVATFSCSIGRCCPTCSLSANRPILQSPTPLFDRWRLTSATCALPGTDEWSNDLVLRNGLSERHLAISGQHSSFSCPKKYF